MAYQSLDSIGISKAPEPIRIYDEGGLPQDIAESKPREAYELSQRILPMILYTDMFEFSQSEQCLRQNIIILKSVVETIV